MPCMCRTVVFSDVVQASQKRFADRKTRTLSQQILFAPLQIATRMSTHLPALIAESSVSPAQPSRRKRGRPSKHGTAMTANQRQRESRARKQAPLRRELRAKILRRLRRLERTQLAYELEGATIRELKWLDKITRRRLTKR